MIPDSGASRWFADRTMVIASMHGKEAAIAPVFYEKLSVYSGIPAGFDTDTFGTFTGEKVREADPYTTCRTKCLAALAHTGADLAIASEGSFGPHPEIPFIPCDEEWLVLIDRKNDLEIGAYERSLATNYGQITVHSLDELNQFARRVQFPSHSIILRTAQEIIKGINEAAVLRSEFLRLLKSGQPVSAETDMRAMHNPSRMKVIAEAAGKLIDNILSACPQCEAPGFVVTRQRPGLPCGLCRQATQVTLAAIRQCQKCGFTREVFHPRGITVADPMYCDYCNP
jgi:hypothetical protein